MRNTAPGSGMMSQCSLQTTPGEGPPFYLINSEWEWNARKAGEACGPKNFFRGGRTEGEGWGWKLQIAPKRTICLPSVDEELSSIHSLGLIRSSLSPPGGGGGSPKCLCSERRGEEKTEPAGGGLRIGEQKVRFLLLAQESKPWLPSRNESPAGRPIRVTAN